MNTIYLDNAASTAVLPSVREALLPWLERDFGNPSARHPMGVAAADGLEDARRRIARALGADLEGGARVVFTSGGTEANNLAVIGLARAGAAALAARDRQSNSARSSADAPSRGHLVIGPTEHASVRAAADALAREGFRYDVAPLAADGALDLDALAALLRPDTVLVAQMVVNNEFGSVYPVEQLVRVVRANAPAARIHADCVQTLGKLPLRLLSLGVDSLAISGHKVHAPKGTGALVLAPGVTPEPLLVGGGQEGGLRSGTENVGGAVALARAVRTAVENQAATLELGTRLRALLAETLDTLGDSLRGTQDAPRLLEIDGGAGRVPTICSVQVPGPPAEVWQHHLETRGVYVGTGAACQAKKRELSPALVALGLTPDEARHVLRISFSGHTTEDEVRGACAALAEVAEAFATASA